MEDEKTNGLGDTGLKELYDARVAKLENSMREAIISGRQIEIQIATIKGALLEAKTMQQAVAAAMASSACAEECETVIECEKVIREVE